MLYATHARASSGLLAMTSGIPLLPNAKLSIAPHLSGDKTQPFCLFHFSMAALEAAIELHPCVPRIIWVQYRHPAQAVQNCPEAVPLAFLEFP